MTNMRLLVLTTLAMIAFASNSLLCRFALKNTAIDASSFSTIRLLSGALMLLLVVYLKREKCDAKGNWFSALALFIYVAGFSFAYVNLSAATGALVLFGAVQATMIMYGLVRGEHFSIRQLVGFVFAFGGLIGLLLPGLSAPPLASGLLMLAAGVAWGIYSLRGKGVSHPIQVTTGNFIRTLPLALCLSLLMLSSASLDAAGIICAIVSGGVASGLGYVLWYSLVPALKATTAATVQLSVPVIAALAGIIFLGEPLTLRLFIAAIAILGGIALVILRNL